MKNNLTDKKKGMFYGLAIGDALGAAVEFCKPDTFKPVTDYRDGGPHGLDSGQWTDDTSMALALADSLAIGWNTKDQLEKYYEWYSNGKYSVTGSLFDIGIATRNALETFARNKSIVNNPEISSSGNGSIMRLAPIPICYAESSIDELCDKARQSTMTTHSSPLCQDCCVYMSVVLVALMNGENKEEVLSRDWWDKKDISLDEKVLGIIENDKESKGTGFVIDSLHAAIWAFKEGNSFEDSVLKGVNLGDDADTTGAVCGQLAGAHWGYKQIPKHLIDGLDKKEMIDLYLNPII